MYTGTGEERVYREYRQRNVRSFVDCIRATTQTTLNERDTQTDRHTEREKERDRSKTKGKGKGK